MAKTTTPDTSEPLPPPPPWAGEPTLQRLVSAALRDPAAAAAPDEIVIDLDDLDVDPRLLELLDRHFAGDSAAVDRALTRYCGKYRSLADYAAQTLESEDLPEWIWPYIDVDAIARDWSESGALWFIEEGGDGRHGPAIHVFGA